mgnify:CR=1 FL=1
MKLKVSSLFIILVLLTSSFPLNDAFAADGDIIATISVGSSPQGIAFDSANNRMYVANYGPNTVSVINTATNAVIATISVGSNPYDVAFDSANNRMYVANYGGNTVSVIDTSDNSVDPSTISVGSGPRDITFDSANNRMYVTNTGSNNVSVINTATNAVIATISVGSSPRGVAFDSANNRMYVVNNGPNNVSVIDTSDNSVDPSTISVGSSPHGIAFDSANNRMYVVNYGNSKVSVINTATNAVDATISVGSNPFGIAFDSANNRMYVTNHIGNTVSVIETLAASPSKVGTVSTTPGNSQVALSWVAPSDRGSSITDYIIQYSTDDSTWSTFADGTSTGTTATVTGLDSSTLYYFQVAAVNSSGTGLFSSSSSASATSATSATSSSGGGGGGKTNCDSNGFGHGNSLRVYQVMYDIDTYQVQVQAYSTCGSISAKITTPTQQSILGLSMNQTLLDDRVAIYSGYLDESDEKFNISIQNKRDSFDETFYIYDKSIITKYTGDTGYTSEQQDSFSPTIPSTQATITSQPPVTVVSQTIEELIPLKKQIVAEKSVIDQTQLMQYTPEPIAEETTESTCGIGTESVNGICKIIIPDESQFCFLFWCW